MGFATPYITDHDVQVISTVAWELPGFASIPVSWSREPLWSQGDEVAGFMGSSLVSGTRGEEKSGVSAWDKGVAGDRFELSTKGL